MNNLAVGETKSLSRVALIASIVSAALSLLLVVAVMTGWLTGAPKVGYVRTGEVISGSVAFKSARSSYEKQIMAWQTNLDTLESEYARNLSQFNSASLQMNADARESHQIGLAEQRATIERYSTAISLRAKEEEKRLSDSLLKQINALVEQYGREHGYDVILGTTSEGSLLYGSEATDITKNVLDFINR